mmetsp:Transcript_7215/g.14161  ORF Transcript_7215/g.14161 Transcript_7215/m.14161 type:complete len:323 (-) Transcript_7215:227-1195(-)
MAKVVVVNCTLDRDDIRLSNDGVLSERPRVSDSRLNVDVGHVAGERKDLVPLGVGSSNIGFLGLGDFYLLESGGAPGAKRPRDTNLAVQVAPRLASLTVHTEPFVLGRGKDRRDIKVGVSNALVVHHVLVPDLDLDTVVLFPSRKLDVELLLPNWVSSAIVVYLAGSLLLAIHDNHRVWVLDAEHLDVSQLFAFVQGKRENTNGGNSQEAEYDVWFHPGLDDRKVFSARDGNFEFSFANRDSVFLLDLALDHNFAGDLVGLVKGSTQLESEIKLLLLLRTALCFFLGCFLRRLDGHLESRVAGRSVSLALLLLEPRGLHSAS